VVWQGRAGDRSPYADLIRVASTRERWATSEDWPDCSEAAETIFDLANEIDETWMSDDLRVPT